MLGVLASRAARAGLRVVGLRRLAGRGAGCCIAISSDWADPPWRVARLPVEVELVSGCLASELLREFFARALGTLVVV